MLAILVLLTYLFTRVEKNSVEKTEVRSFNTLENISIRTSLESYERYEGEIIGPLKYLKTSLDIEKVWQALKERILTQIQVQKLSGGFSQITGQGCYKVET